LVEYMMYSGSHFEHNSVTNMRPTDVLLCSEDVVEVLRSMRVALQYSNQERLKTRAVERLIFLIALIARLIILIAC